MIKTGLCFLFFCIHCINRCFKHAGKNSIEYCPIDVIFNQQYVQQKYFISLQNRKNIVPDSQGASWRTCDDVNRQPIKLKDGRQAAKHEQQMKR